jgi:ADP-dependent NAD(P)H-hydrate dehydratase / NAD(P)H-hydrate epimerase
MPERAISALESAVIEANAIALGWSVATLMESAGRAVAEEAARVLPPAPSKVAIVAGSGNNGGDGSTAAFYLQQWGYAPELWMVRPASEIRSPASRQAFERIRRRLPTHLEVPAAGDLEGFPLLIDALLGTGQSGALREPYASACRAIRDSNAPVLSVDVPSGEGEPGAVRARWTVALTAPKTSAAGAEAGTIIVRDIGIPRVAREETGPGEFALFPRLGPSGRSARLVIFGGGPYAGAPALAGLAALRSGAERATIFTPASTSREVQSFSPTLVVEPLGEDHFRAGDVSRAVERLGQLRYGAIALGMGAGRDPETVDFFAQLLERLPKRVPCLLDADALEAVVRPRIGSEERSLLLTPNAGELLRLAHRSGEPEEAERIGLVEGLASVHALTVLAKGAPDILGGPTRHLINRHHHPAASVAGVGDVLDGVGGALLAGGLDPFSAGRLAAYWVGDAGVRAFGLKSYGVLATDVIEALPTALADGLRRLGRE